VPGIGPGTAGSRAAIRREAASSSEPLGDHLGRAPVRRAEPARVPADRVRVGTAERVDRLVRIADDDELATVAR
jgi:hypothetical protein